MEPKELNELQAVEDIIEETTPTVSDDEIGKDAAEIPEETTENTEEEVLINEENETPTLDEGAESVID